MPRIAIVISAVGSTDSLEATLVSVLENRPADCEIFVALDKPYADPYGLKDEVRFVHGAKRSRFIKRVNDAIAATRAPFVHLLASGCTVTEGWTEPALARFGDRRVASVAPLVMHTARPGRILAAGLGYRRGGRRFVVGRGESELQPGIRSPIVGPCGFAAFYRKAALDLVGGLDAKLGPLHADIDLALALAKAGFSVAVEPQSLVSAAAEVDAHQGAFSRALDEEQLFWRNLPSTGRTRALAAHAALVGLELLGSFMRPRMLPQVAGRGWACCQIGSYARRHALLRHLALGARDTKSAEGPSRIDPSHQSTLRSPSARAGQRVSRPG